MNLHANAALSLKGRRELCRAVVDRERTLTAPAWPTPKSSPTKAGAPSSVFSDERSRSTPATASPCSGS
jgi:hypothetical protein